MIIITELPKKKHLINLKKGQSIIYRIDETVYPNIQGPIAQLACLNNIKGVTSRIMVLLDPKTLGTCKVVVVKKT